MKTVYTAGVFDLFHVGHLNLLMRAKELGDRLIVGVLSDEAAEAYKPRPVVPWDQRITIVSSIKYVDFVIPQGASDATPELKLIKPDVLVHGDDWTEDWEIGQTWMQENGKEFVLLPYTKGISSTQIKKEVRG